MFRSYSFVLSSNLNRHIRNFHHKIETKSNYIILSLNKTPVNSLNLEALTELNQTLDSVERDQKLKGVILTSVLIH